MMPMVATHRRIKDFAEHIWDDHVYDGPTPSEIVELVEFHAQLHSSGLGHKDEGEGPVREVKDEARGRSLHPLR